MQKTLLVSHGDLSKGFVSSLEVITGVIPGIDTISMGTEESLEEMKDKIESYVEQCSNEDIIIILCDLPIGTTTKAAIPAIYQNKDVYVISGINLPLLLTVVLTDLLGNTTDLIRDIVEESKSTILFMNDVLNDVEEERKEELEC